MNKHQLDRLLRSDQAVKFQTSLLKTMMPIDKIKNKRNPDASISEWFSRLNTRVETKLQEWLELFNVEPACKPECPYCCYQPILVNQFEAKAILGYLSENNKLDEVMNSLKAWKGQVSYEALKTPNVNNEQEIYRLKEYWFQAKLPCPLLKNNKCVAYPVRPSSCITYLTFGQSVKSPLMSLFQLDTKA